MVDLGRFVSLHFMRQDKNSLNRKHIDKESFEAAFSKYWERLYCYCFKMTNDIEVSQNIVQNIFVDLWEKRNKIVINDIENYLFKSAKFQSFNHYRDKKLNPEILRDTFEENIEANEDISEHKLLEELEVIIDKLPEKRGEIVRMNKIQNMSISEIATSLNISKQTVKNQISAALKQMKEEAVIRATISHGSFSQHPIANSQ